MNLLKILYPDRCPLCDCVRPLNETGFCPECRKKLKVIKEPACEICGRPLKTFSSRCRDCTGKQFDFDGGKCLYAYSDVTASIYKFKYMNREAYSRDYAKEIADNFGDWLDGLKPDALIPVPLHKKRLIKRGYNQAEELAKEISLLTGIPVKASLVARVKNTVPQKLKDRKDRFSNVKKAFIVRENVVDLRRVVIVDDIFTTGSTIAALAHELKKAGVEKVFYLTLSRAGVSNTD